MDFLSSSRFLIFLLVVGTDILTSDCSNQAETTSQQDGQSNKVSIVPSTDPKQVKFWLYHPNATSVQYVPLLLTNSTSVECELKVGNMKSIKACGFNAESNSMIILAAGFLAQRASMFPIRDEYLKYGYESKNVILLDWSRLASSFLPLPLSYFAVQRNVPIVAQRTVELFSFLLENGQLKDLTGVHIVGLSLGAHLGGSIGNIAQKKLNLEIGRITGLEPSGPFLQFQKPKDRLSPPTASFVDVLHTDNKLLGNPDQFGHVDFYANGGIGTNQNLSDPRCVLPENNTIAEYLLYYLTPAPILCAHIGSLRYWAQTIPIKKNNRTGQIVPVYKFRACPCKSGKNPKKDPCPKPQRKCPKETIFGEYVDSNVRGKYYFEIKKTVHYD